MRTPHDPDGWVLDVRLTSPSIQDNTADVDRLRRAICRQLDVDWVDVDLDLARCLPDFLRNAGYAVRCLVFKDRDRALLIDVQAASETPVWIGAAVDLGSTRVVLRLIDLFSCTVLAETAFDNPQIAFGADILSRIHHADLPGGAARLQQVLVDGLNQQLGELCRAHGLATTSIGLIAMAGNTAMSHLVAGLPARWIIREPYIPAVNRFGLLRAHDLGVAVNPLARVMLFPCVGSYFGGDLVAGILFAGLHQRETIALMVDVGTNAEVVLGNRDWLMACAGAAGPALEGGVSSIGTMAAPGVIDRVWVDPETGGLAVHTIAERPAVGICGSGVIDLAAALFSAGLIDLRGKFRPDACGDRLVIDNGHPYFILVPAEASGTGRALRISQADLDSLIRSKAAMFTILETLTATMGLALEEMPAFLVAGTFGSFIDPRSAITIGMLPDLPLERFQSLGNSSLGGATLVLTQRAALRHVDAIRDGITYMELNVNQEFMNRFSAAKFIPHTNPSRFPSVKPPLR